MMFSIFSEHFKYIFFYIKNVIIVLIIKFVYLRSPSRDVPPPTRKGKRSSKGQSNMLRNTALRSEMKLG